MKINTNSFIRNASLISKMYDVKNPLTANMYLDFENSFAYLRDNQLVQARFPFVIEDRDTDIPNLLVDSKKFLSVCEIYPDSEISVETVENHTDRWIFRHGTEEYNLGPVANSRHFDISVFEEDSEESVSFIVEEEFYKTMKIASHYVNPDSETPYVYLKNNIMYVVSNTMNLYFNKIGDNYPDALFTMDSVDFILHASIGATMSISDSAYRIEKPDNSMFIIPTKADATIFEGVLSDNFTSAYQHEDYFKVPHKKFISFLMTLNAFAQDVENGVATLSINSEEKLLMVELTSESSNIKRNILLTDCSGDFDFPIIITLADFSKNIKNLSLADEVTIQIGNKTITNSKGEEKESPFFNIFTNSVDEHFVQKRYLQ